MANVTSTGSGGSSEINAVNFRKRLESATSEADIQAVVNKILRNEEIHQSIKNEGLTPGQRDKLLAHLATASKQGLNITKGGEPIGVSFAQVRKVILNAKDPHTLLQKEKAALVKELTAKADAIHQQVQEVHKKLAGQVDRMQELARKKGLLERGFGGYIARVRDELAQLELQVKGWATGGDKRAAFMKGLDQKEPDSATLIVRELQLSLNSALQSVWPISSELQLNLQDLEREGRAMATDTVLSLGGPFSRAEQIYETASTLNQKIVKAESPATALKRLKKEKAVVTKEVTRLVDVIHEEYQKLQQALEAVLKYPRMFHLDETDKATKEMLSKYQSALPLVKSEVNKWGEGGKSRQVAMGALDLENYSELKRLLPLSSEFYETWLNAMDIPPAFRADLKGNKPLLGMINGNNKYVTELSNGPFRLLQGQIEKAIGLNQSMNAALLRR